ncbi:Trp biosynthesis-associated membrane protein [Timonella sp. A28]|uniref:Trp biosynthesis-associated membrane protein n=1 Tax=Timonella sp. A28 TaxID=3442640 RepID=UPI003EB81A0F
MSTMSRKTCVLTALVLAGLTIALAQVSWFSTTVTTVLGEDVVVQVSAHSAAPGITASSIVAVAAALLISLSGKIIRYVALSVLTISALTVVISAVGVLVSPRSAVRSQVEIATSTSFIPDDIAVYPTGYVVVVLGVLLCITGVMGIRGAHVWGRSTSRYERTEPQNAERDISRTPDVAVQDDGEDTHLRSDDKDLWDALSRGEDPTDGETSSGKQ